jgi:hypothetical protein
MCAGSVNSNLAFILHARRSIRMVTPLDRKLGGDGLAVAGACGIRARRLRPEVDSGSWLGAEVAAGRLLQRELPSYGSEEIADVVGRLCGRLEEEEPRLLGVSLGISDGDGTLVWVLSDQIRLVAGKGDDDVLVRLPLQLLDPRLGLIQRGLSHVSIALPPRPQGYPPTG